MDDDTATYTEPADARDDDDALASVRYGLTALGEALLAERSGAPRFVGFGPCAFALA